MHRHLCILLAGPAAALAQSNIDPAHKYSWSENAGWMNWRDADNGVHGVRVHSTYLSGWIWSENLGWISLGHTPANGTAYSNNAPDYGVNILPSGALAGYAWGESIGWINFATPSLGADHARIDAAAGRFSGYAWGENIGWLNLNHAEHYVAFTGPSGCYANCDASTTAPVLNVADFSCFLQKFASGDSYANCDASTTAPVLNVADFSCFLQKFASGCN